MGEECKVINVLWAASELRFFLAAFDWLPATGCCRSPGSHWLPSTNWLSLVALDKADCHWLLPISCLFIAATDQLAHILPA